MRTSGGELRVRVLNLREFSEQFPLISNIDVAYDSSQTTPSHYILRNSANVYFCRVYYSYTYSYRFWYWYCDIVTIDDVSHNSVLLVLEVDHPPWLCRDLGDGENGLTCREGGREREREIERETERERLREMQE